MICQQGFADCGPGQLCTQQIPAPLAYSVAWLEHDGSDNIKTYIPVELWLEMCVQHDGPSREP